MSPRKRRPSLLGGLIWAGLGVLFLLSNLAVIPDVWAVAGRYWPILLILLGLGKVIDYFRRQEGVSIRVGEVIAIVFLLLIGGAITRVQRSNFGRILGEIPIHIGGTSVSPAQWIGTSYSYTQEASYPLLTPTPLRIENSYGPITLTPGSDDEIRVRLRKVVFIESEARAKAIANEIQLMAGTEGVTEAEETVRVEAAPQPKGSPPSAVFVVKTNRDSLGDKDYRFNTDVEVFVPKQSQITVRNSFGEVKAVNLEGDLDLSTSHNLLEVRDCSGKIAVANQYAEARLINITGNVSVEARGRVRVEGVKGDVSVQNQYSPVDVRDVEGTVSVANTDSTVRVEGVSKPVSINGYGCQVTVRGLKDSLQVSTSHKAVQISDVSSNVILETRYSSVTLKNLGGNLDITSNSDRINLTSLAGYLKVNAQGSGVQVNTAAGPVDITTTLKDVAVNNFSAGCKVVNEYGDVTLSTGSLGKGDLNVKNRNGDIQLFLPEDAAFEISATARHGRVDSDFAGLEPVERDGNVGTLGGKVKSGGPKIVLDTEYSNIHLRGRDSKNAKDGDSESKKRKQPRQVV